ncbi:hypothetical protein LTR84_009597 [Exophiala bonariae]|uniref:SprT-like domain-containing protein n=1 Tax=Exophiala bonariae TaxID=1690606 RepID=A0AAV9NIN8_9EURO|nr:hypothetical protein LTR84_009597 [Exophiala bonariae]
MPKICINKASRDTLDRFWASAFSTSHEQSVSATNVLGEGILHLLRKSNFTLVPVRPLASPPDTWLANPAFYIDDTFYDRIRPALLLASRLVYESRWFFDNVWARDIAGEDGKLFFDHESELVTTQIYNWQEEVFGEVSNFQILLGYYGHGYKSYGTLHTWFYPANPAAQDRVPVFAMRLNEIFYKLFTDPSFTAWPKDKIQRTMFLLAVTIVHELIHLCYAYKTLFDYRFGVEAPEVGAPFLSIRSKRRTWLGLDEMGIWRNSSPSRLRDSIRPAHELHRFANLPYRRHLPVDATDLAQVFDARCWRIHRVINKSNTTRYIKLFGDDFIDAMRVVGRISNWQATYGNSSWPTVEELENIQAPSGMSPAVRTTSVYPGIRKGKEQRQSETIASGLSALITAFSALAID